MRRFLIFLVILVILCSVLVKLAREKIGRDLRQPVADRVLSPTPTLTIDKNAKTATAIFVPYWALNGQDLGSTNYNTYLYFGITPDGSGIVTEEPGAQHASDFVSAVPDGKEKVLTLRMVKSDINAAILKDKTLQKKIIAQTVAFAKSHGFSGIALDLEISAIPIDALVEQISAFTKSLASQSKQSNLRFSSTVYGDTFYRVRPFDIKAIAQNSDSVMVMAYDFHKSRANPGPNFPLSGSKTYGYDLGKMVDDFVGVVPPEKITVILGLFGYDWMVDANGKALSQGQPLTYLQIKQKFLNDCTYTACQVKRDAVSAETVIHYTDDNQQKHIVWFEDMQSVRAKQQYLRTRGITNFAFWAYSYF